MACNAIATASARIPLDLPEQLAQFLDIDSAKVVIEAHLNQMSDGQASFYKYGDVLVVENNEFVVTYQAGEISVRARSIFTAQAVTKALADEIKGLLTQAAGMIMQGTIAQAIGQMAFVESEQITASGAMVLTIDI